MGSQPSGLGAGAGGALGDPERVAEGKRVLGMAWSFVVLFFVGERTLGGTSPGGEHSPPKPGAMDSKSLSCGGRTPQIPMSKP